MNPNDAPAIIDYIFGEDYEGPLSDWDEWHSLEMGLFGGVVYGATGNYDIVAGMVAISLGKKTASGEISRQIAREPHYFGVGFILGYILSAGWVRGIRSLYPQI